MEQAAWIALVRDLGGVIGTAVTAVATIFLWLVTRTLAKETKRLAKASAQPQVVATIEHNRWAMQYADLHVSNTGNATAYDVSISFEPPLPIDDLRDSIRPPPLQTLSVLKPGQALHSSLSKFAPLIDKTFIVTVSWRSSPSSPERESNVYPLDMSFVRGITRLGSADPLTQIAEQMKKMREDWQSVAQGNRRIKTDVFTSNDRSRQARELEALWRQESERGGPIDDLGGGPQP